MHFRSRGNMLQFARNLPSKGEQGDIQSTPGAGTADMATGVITEFVKGSLTEAEIAEINDYIAKSKGVFTKRNELELATLAERLKEIAQSVRHADDEIVALYGDGIIQAMGSLRQMLVRKVPTGPSDE